MNNVSLLNSLLDDFNYGLAMPCLEAPAYTPAVDVVEHKDSYELVMDLPGMTQDDIDLSVKENTLTIASKQDPAAENKAGAEQKDENKDAGKYLIRERFNASFSRSFTLPRNADSQQISATFKNGVLYVTIPCKAELAERKIQISAA
ncbi:MAG: Hsp20/alpha crystallin family protein [Treponema sp.]|nr:Hsp20/alpha crystallin family protein [Treponema sp.]